jgi:predicted phosphoadenosine phosphosulfate sulfurtransferase
MGKTRMRIVGYSVFEAAVQRMVEVYEQGHRVIVSFSGGKDSGACLEVCRVAAAETGRLPVEVVIRDEEVMFPGTYEYVERVAADPDIDLHWLVAHQPIINVYNRQQPYWWVFDPTLDPEQWVRPWPERAEVIDELNIGAMVTTDRFPPPEGKDLYSVVGLRVSESRGRMYGIFSAGGHTLKPNNGVIGIRPIYDWTDSDIWLAHNKFHWDYNEAYDVLHRMGVSKHALRIAPPSMNADGAQLLRHAASAWPRWFSKASERLPGLRIGAQFGRRAIEPRHKVGETWEETFKRECLGPKAPEWIQQRSEMIMNRLMSAHNRHSTAPFPEVAPCNQCVNNLGSWKNLTNSFYNGDPFSTKCSGILPFVEPEYFTPHEYIISNWSEECARLWPDTRDALEMWGEARPFTMQTRQGPRTVPWTYLDLSDGYTYWVMRKWVHPPPGWIYDPAEGYIINRVPINGYDD